jgi:2-dehydro-3-deoxyphosphooctonate aldolase (KDO 8-P synthase)
MRFFKIGEDARRPVEVSSDRPFLIAGPCVIESEDHCLMMAREIDKIANSRDIDVVFKASFDKANRTSVDSFRGPGLEKGLQTLERVRNEVGLPVTTDIHDPTQAEAAGRVVDLLQIPAFLCRQTDLIAAAARTGRAINIKKGQFLAPWDMCHPIEKARRSGCDKIIVTERGTSFGYNNLIVDVRSLFELQKFGCPVVFDATHSVQTPGGQGTSSGGDRQYIDPLIRAASAVGATGVFVEVHDRPDKALCDGPNALPLGRLGLVIDTILRLDDARRDCL